MKLTKRLNIRIKINKIPPRTGLGSRKILDRRNGNAPLGGQDRHQQRQGGAVLHALFGLAMYGGSIFPKMKF